MGSDGRARERVAQGKTTILPVLIDARACGAPLAADALHRARPLLRLPDVPAPTHDGVGVGDRRACHERAAPLSWHPDQVALDPARARADGDSLTGRPLPG